MGSVMGIVLEYTNQCNFTYNLIQENIEWGGYIYHLVNEYNIFHNNSFISNAIGLGIPRLMMQETILFGMMSVQTRVIFGMITLGLVTILLMVESLQISIL